MECGDSSPLSFYKLKTKAVTSLTALQTILPANLFPSSRPASQFPIVRAWSAQHLPARRLRAASLRDDLHRSDETAPGLTYAPCVARRFSNRSFARRCHDQR